MNAPVDYELLGVKIPPNSLEAEQSVIGGLLMADKGFDVIADTVSADDFYRPEHRMMFNAIAKLADEGQPHDVITVDSMLADDAGYQHAGGLVYLANLARNTPSSANIRAYALVVRERAMLRKLIMVGQEIADSGFNADGRKSNELIDEAQAAVIALSENGSVQQDLHCSSRLKGLFDEWERRSECKGLIGLSTGFEKLDQRTNGLQPSDLIIIAARPSMGKTTLVMNMVENVAVKQGKPALVFSMEMSAQQLLDRMAASVGKIPFNLIKNGTVFDTEYDHWVIPTLNRLKGSPLYIDDRAALSISQMRSTARKVHKKNPLGLIVVDYLQLAKAKAESRVMEVTQISQGLKALAKELGVPVIALSQLNRQVDGRGDKRPVMSDLRDSGAIEQDADLIWFIYRDEVYDEQSKMKGAAEIICAKNRNGETGTDCIASILSQCRFEDLPPGWQPPKEEEKEQKKRGGFEY